MADATVKAEMRMDNKQFLDASRQSTAEIKRVKTESKMLAREIGGVNSVATGLSAIMTGNLSAGLASVSRGFSEIAPKITAMLGPIGLVVAAFGAAYAAGKRLDSLIGISDRVAKRFGGDTSATDELARQTERIRAIRRGRQESQKLDEENEIMAEKRLAGIARMEADYARERADVEKKLAETKNADVRNSLQARLDMMETFHKQDVAAAQAAEAEKLRITEDAEKRRIAAQEQATMSRTRQIEDENERMRIAMLEGAERIQAEFARDVANVDMRIDAGDATEEQRALLEEQKRILEQRRNVRLAEIDAAQQQQQQAGMQQARIPGRADQLAAGGGFLGGERISLNVEKKAERLQMDNNRYLQNNNRAVADLTQQVQTLAAAMNGGVV